MCLIPITDGAVKADVPFKGKEQHGTIIVVGEDVDHRVNHTAEDEGQPPMSASVGHVHEAPEKNGIDDERRGRM